MVPLFFIGSLDEAIQEALLCSAKSRKLLGIYLHNDSTVFCNIFAAKSMCDENVVHFLSANFLVWPWDLTSKATEAYFYDMCAKHLGSVFMRSVRDMRDKMPLLLIVTRARATNEVVAIVEGDATSESLMHRLMQTYEMFEEQRMRDELDEQTRDERERIKRDQDAAYQASLELDKAKRQRQVEESEKQRADEQRQAEIEAARLAALDKRKQDALLALGAEPSGDERLTRIRFRLPDGGTVQRKFRAGDKLQALVDFATANGFFVEEFKMLSSWPRRDLTAESLEATLEQLKLVPQETITIEQR